MKKILINLKDWLNLHENIDYAEQIAGLDITVFPSLPYLYLYKNRGVRVGSQKISSFEDGPHTGSISANHLKDFDVEAVILNHRECLIDESEKLISKITNAQEFYIETILCIGSASSSEINKIKSVLTKVKPKGISIAYEPIEDIELDEIKLNLEHIKRELSDFDVSYIYGSNVTTTNIEELNKELDVTGFLISSHALSIDNLKSIIKTLKND